MFQQCPHREADHRHGGDPGEKGVRVQENDEGEHCEEQAGEPIGAAVQTGETRVHGDGNAEGTDQHEAEGSELRAARLDHEFRAGEDRGHQDHQGQGDTDCMEHGADERCIGDPGGDCSRDRGRGREFAEDGDEKGKKVDHPRIDAGLDKKRSGDHGQHHIGGGDWEPHTDQVAKNKCSHDHCDRVKSGQLHEECAHLVGHPGYREGGGEDAEGCEQDGEL